MKDTIYVIALWLICILTACNTKNAVDLNGSWLSEAIEKNDNGTFGKRQFTFDDRNWEVKFTLYVDSAATQPVFTFRGVGTYSLGNPSAKMQDAAEAVFSFSHKYITLHTADTSLINIFGFASCALLPETEKEITVNGCSFLESKSVCAQEYDLVSLKEEKLYLGARPTDGKNMCNVENRPAFLGSPLAKAN